MNVTLLKALIAFAPACLLFLAAIILFLKEKSAGFFLQSATVGTRPVVMIFKRRCVLAKAATNTAIQKGL